MLALLLLISLELLRWEPAFVEEGPDINEFYVYFRI